MTSTAAARASVAVLVALALASCAQPGAGPTVAPDGPPPSASASATPTAAPSVTPSAAADARRFEAQDGAARFELPEGWTVDDRSAMGDASEMYDRGPGWLNDLVVLDADGDQMLWYREHYGTDTYDCDIEQPDVERTEIAPLAPELVAALEADGYDIGTTYVQVRVAEAAEFRGDAQPGDWAVRMEVIRVLPEEDGCVPVVSEMATGSRVVLIDAVGDTEGEQGMPDTTIDFADEQSARAWLQSDEHAAILEVLASLELTDAPMLDAAP